MPKKKALEIDDGLTDMQRLFVAEYLKSKNATEAAIKAGFSERSADKQGWQLLGKPRIANAIRRAMDRIEKRVMIAAENVLIELGKIAFADPRKVFNENGDLLPPKDWPDEIAGAIQAIEIEEIREPYTGDVIGKIKKIKFWDKNKALDNLGKHFKLFDDKIEININDGLAERLAQARAYAIEAKKRLIEDVGESKAEERNRDPSGERDSQDHG